VSNPPWPSTLSLPSPGFQMKVSSPSPRSATSLPVPLMTVIAVAPDHPVTAVAAVDRELDQAGTEA
jgi:hypothetical protein